VIWVIVAAVAVIGFTAWIMYRRRGAGRGEPTAGPATVALPEAEPAVTEVEREPAEVVASRPEAAEEVYSEPQAAPIGEDVEKQGEAEAVVAEAEPVAEAAPAEPAAPKTSPKEEMRSRVEAQLEDSARLLDELKEAASRAGEDSPLSGGSVGIMEEGLQEVQALAQRKQWSQAKDKGEALHAQLSLLLQGARREKSP
jgi:hypothetical protein